MISDLKLVKDKVAYILEKYPQARDCDKTLWLAYLVIFRDLKSSMGQDAYYQMKKVIMDKTTCSMESVVRVRRKFQENGEWVGKSRKKKMEEAENVKRWAVNEH